MSFDFNDLNDAQRKAVTHTGSHLLIVAGPGTGKTHTLTCRIAQYLPQLTSSEKILAITFTNKAAEEMRTRLKQRLDGECKRLEVGTFHSFCLNVLRQFYAEAGLSNDFKVAAPEEIEALFKAFGAGGAEKESRKALEQISLWKAGNLEQGMPEEVMRYNRTLRDNNLLDFDDLLRETWRLLKNNEAIRRKIQKSCRYIFVDEYQDVNLLQHALLRCLVGEGVHLTAIGDPNQAIYGFRGASVEFFRNFEQDFPGTVKLSLAENYRSAANLLKASGQMIRRESALDIPPLTARIYTEGRLTIFEASTDKAEAEYAVHTVEKLVGGTSMFSQDSGRVAQEQSAEYSFQDIVILYRLNAQRVLLEKALARSGIPYQIYGQRILEETADFSAERVNLMTLHAAKGLEFPVVLIVGCEQGLLPLQLEGMKGDPQEERRLFYVGMTRAKERLYLIRAKRRMIYGKTYRNESSPFLKDIEEQLKSHEKSRPFKSAPAQQQLTLFGRIKK